jgi:hypothetical protein
MSHANPAPVHGTEHPIVLIAPEEVLAGWSARAARPVGILALADVDDEHALEVIRRRRPTVVVLMQMFASSARGASFVSQLRGRADLAGLDIRLLPASRSSLLGSAEVLAGHVLANAAQPLPQGPLRRAPRLTMPSGVEMRVEGACAALVNVSPLGAQVVSPTALKPRQQVEIVIDRYDVNLHTTAKIVWSSLELSRGAIAYRAGLAFPDAHPEVLKLEAIAAAQAA